MNTLDQTAAPPVRQPARRPSSWRKFGSFYLDLLFASFLGWILSNAFASRDLWSTLSLGFYLLQRIGCRGALKPTLGEFFMNIRYLSSTSNQVVADIRIVDSKLKLNGFFYLAGLLETTWAVGALTLWTLYDKAAFMGREWGNPAAFSYYVVFGILMFLCAALLLSGSRNASWAVPSLHGILLLDLFRNAVAWIHLLPGVETVFPWAEKASRLSPDVVSVVLLAFAVWSLVLSVGILLYRKSLVH